MLRPPRGSGAPSCCATSTQSARTPQVRPGLQPDQDQVSLLTRAMRNRLQRRYTAVLWALWGLMC